LVFLVKEKTMIYKAIPDKNLFIGLNRERIKYGLHIKQRTKKQGVHAGSVIVKTEDVRSAKTGTDIEGIEASSTLSPTPNIGLPKAFHPTILNTTFLVNTLTDAQLYFPQFNNIGLRTTFPEFYYAIHGSGNFTAPVYVTNF